MTTPHDRHWCGACANRPDIDDALALAMEYAASLKPEECVAEEVYRHRLRVCNQCEYLNAGHTCGQCGCFVVARAKKASMCCPDPGGSRW